MRLKRLDISDEYVLRLEVEALPVVRGYSHTLPALRDVDEALRDVKRHLIALQASLEKLRTAPDVAAHKREAFSRLCNADYQVRRSRGAPSESYIDLTQVGAVTQGAIDSLNDVFRFADDSLPRERSKTSGSGVLVQRRKRSSPQAIEAIWMAIGGYDQGWSGVAPSLSVSSKEGPFRELVRICYEAAGQGEDCDPVHAIKLFEEYLKTQGG